MNDHSFANLISGKPIRWERPFFLFAALFVSDLVWMELGPDVHWSAQSGFHFSFFEVYPPWSWVSIIIGNVILTVVATAAFRLVPNQLVALAIVLVLYPPLSIVMRNIIFLIEISGNWRPELPDIAQSLVSSFAYVLCFVGALMLALRFIKPLLIALLAGAIVGTTISQIVSLIIHRVVELFSSSDVRSPAEGLLGQLIDFFVGSLPFAILSAALFAVVFWAALWLSGSLTSEEPVAKPRLRRPFYAGIWAVAVGICWFLSANTLLMVMLQRWELSQRSSRTTTFGSGIQTVVIESVRSTELVAVFLIFGIALAFALVASVLFVIVIYKMWAAIQDGHARTDPGRAVGFLFIPIFNIYWAFQALWGFAKDYNSYLDRHGLNLRRLPEGLFVAYIILCLGAWIPFLGWLLVGANVVVGTMMIAKICDAVNALPEAGQPPAANQAAA